MLKIYFFQMAVNTYEMWSNGIKIAFFSKNVQKSTPVCDTFEYTSLLNTSPNLDICSL